MIKLILPLTLLCSETTVINKTKLWNEIDKKSLKSAKERCKVYFPEAPCLKKFIKTEINAYRAICGKKETN